jgi:dihydrofolate reductase
MINAIFAVDQNGGMGFNGSMPWPHNSADLQNFKDLTTGHIVVMGRNTWDDKHMPKPLPGRITYVATNASYLPNTSVIGGDLKQEILKLERKYSNKIIWIIGGVDILLQCDGLFDQLYLTHHKGAYRSDTRVNLKSFLSGWSQKTASADPNTTFTTVVYESLFKRVRS